MTTWRNIIGAFAAGLVVGIWMVLWQGDTIGSRLNHAGAVLTNAAQPTYVDTAFADFSPPAPALRESYIADVKSTRRPRQEPSSEPARRRR